MFPCLYIFSSATRSCLFICKFASWIYYLENWVLDFSPENLPGPSIKSNVRSLMSLFIACGFARTIHIFYNNPALK